MFEVGTFVEITTKARAYTHMGYTDPGYILPETKAVFRVKSKRMTKNGLKVHFRDQSNCGFAIDVEKTQIHSFRTVEAWS
jgi:hypothetical protein